MTERIAFIGGGNMAASLIGGLRSRGFPVAQITVAEPVAEQREKLQQQFGVRAVTDAARA